MPDIAEQGGALPGQAGPTFPYATPAGNTLVDIREAAQGGMEYYYEIGEYDPLGDCPCFYASPGVEYSDDDIDTHIAERQQQDADTAAQAQVMQAIQPQIDAFTATLVQAIADGGIDVTNPDAVEQAVADMMTAQSTRLQNNLAGKQQIAGGG